MSDKALVKHLQREVARLESELKTPAPPPPSSSDYAALLRKKDLQIQKVMICFQNSSANIFGHAIMCNSPKIISVTYNIYIADMLPAA